VSSFQDIRKRIQALNRTTLPPVHPPSLQRLRADLRHRPGVPANSSTTPLIYLRSLPHPGPPPALPPIPTAPPINLQQAVDGKEITTPDGGKAFLISANVLDLLEHPAHLHQSFAKLLLRDHSCVRRCLARGGHCPDLTPEQIVFVDLETTGLAFSPLVLIGTMAWQDAHLVVRQYLARDYAEEGPVIWAFAANAVNAKLLVTFNGKSFDLPYLRTRASAHRIPLNINMAHLDLLHECRRAYRRVLPDCRLQTLERHICGRLRHDDIPGHLIPEAYHAFVRSGDARQLAVIVEHNRRDLITSAQLMTSLPDGPIHSGVELGF
jgi:uncharacterized protein YprB with RNaseH-like and TPR domain